MPVGIPTRGHRRICSKTYAKQHRGTRSGDFAAAETILERFGRPDVVAVEADVFPAERADMGEKRVGQKFALSAKLGDGAAEIDGVSEGDGGDREVETRGPVALIFEGAVPREGSRSSHRLGIGLGNA
jgi:hypothetical protein